MALRKGSILVIMVLVGLLAVTSTLGAQNLNDDQWLNLLGAENEAAFDHFLSMGARAVPMLKNAMETKWNFHAYIPQRTQVVKVLVAMDDIATLPGLKLGLTLEPSIRSEAVDGVLALDELDLPNFMVELILDTVDYQAAQLEILRKLFDDDKDIVALVNNMFDELVSHSDNIVAVDQTADLIAKFIIEDKKVVEPPRQVTREMILQALLAQQQAKDNPPEEAESEPADINALLLNFLLTEINQGSREKQTLALRSIGRLADLVRGWVLHSEFSFEDFVEPIITVLLDSNQNSTNRILAAYALEQFTPIANETLEAFATVLFEAGINPEVQAAAVRVLENGGKDSADLLIANWDHAIELETPLLWRLASAYVQAANHNSEFALTLLNTLPNANEELELFINQVLATVEILETNAKASGSRYVFTPNLPSFPGAEGRGATATGGRGGEVYIVTNLNDSGPGSLRDAVSKPNRTVVFAISGTIELHSQLRTAANITIAGQTAPGDGIAVADYPTLINGGNSIVRFMRFRLGDRQGLTSSDALNIARNVSHVIIDHCSVSWGTDEVFSSYDNSEITVQYSMFGEGLNWLNHSAVGLWGPRTTYHHNLIYTNKTRHPKLAYLGDIVEFSNNVVYNWRERSVYTGSQGRINFIANYFKPGPETQSSRRNQLVEPDGNDVRIYIVDNVMEGNPAVSENNWLGVTKSAIQMHEPYESAPITYHTAEEAYEILLAKAGAYLPRRDAVDERVINDVINGTGKVILRQNEVGGFPIMNSVLPLVDSDQDGMPDIWEIYNGLNPFDPADASYDQDGDGYTNLEEYLNAIVAGDPLFK